MTKPEDIFDIIMSLRAQGDDVVEAERERLIHEFIDSYPEEKRGRLHAFQWKIDRERAKYIKNPIMSMNHMFAMLFEKVGEFQEALTQPSVVMERRQKQIEANSASVTEVDFRNKKS